MFHVGKLLFISVLAIGLGVFLGTVPLADGLTAAEHSEAFFDRDSAPRSQIHAAKRIESRQAARVAAPKNARATSRQSARAASTKPKASPAQVATTRTAPPPAANGMLHSMAFSGYAASAPAAQIIMARARTRETIFFMVQTPFCSLGNILKGVMHMCYF